MILYIGFRIVIYRVFQVTKVLLFLFFFIPTQPELLISINIIYKVSTYLCPTKTWYFKTMGIPISLEISRINS